ncbi:glycoside hydrolase [Nocardioides guangzhouensis]|uniref:Glycoside hydrolase n=1 Tax=Nocardioides guangzhouensis TaxID=2497878 RepID=A0A4Q4ZI53_9ACTN|nr:glycoside hydrolase [Nocardioides guangzhouensis]
MTVHEHFRIPTRPVADPANVIAGDHYRISVLDAGLVRLEYSPSGRFEDRASQTVLDRAFNGPVEHAVTDTGDQLVVGTDRFELTYDKGPFTTHGLSVRAKGGFHSHDSLWRFGMDTPNLGGTARTLDDIDGEIDLEGGVLAFNGIAMVDDSDTVLLDADGWIAPRTEGNLDLYVFAYGRDYKQGLKALYALTGPTPLLPRHALGNWWSRYHPYTDDEYVGLIDRFREEGVPFSVGVIDMDWHLVDIDPAYGSGWTGYTWNNELFPDPAGFLAALHERGLSVALNVHPAEGVHAHESAYAAIARRMGIDPDTETPVVFDPTDPDFLEAYFEELHHPLEAEGVDFWWLDWQQGGVTRIPGLDPLWLLNHFHYLDSGRDGRRPLTFSRYAGVGSHRYPVGFSGDTHITWESLEFQPRFTATASNVGYGWWSHDVGGHFKGYKDDELATRWVQLGTFSPILRLHSGLNPFNTREPWRYSSDSERVMKQFLRLRHRLLPYLATMNVRAHEGEPLVQPMYYDHPEQAEAYTVPNQFMFGPDLLVAPITSPRDEVTGLGRVRAWLPEGEWVDVFTGLRYTGGRTLLLHRDLDSIPVLVRAGTVLPLASETDAVAGTDLPEVVDVQVYAGADGAFTLVEDRDDDRWARTRLTWDDGAARLTVHDVEGDPETLPVGRRYDVTVFAKRPNAVEDQVFAILDRARTGLDLKATVLDVVRDDGAAARTVSTLQALDLPPTLLAALTEVLLAEG